jgi:hypothetical protein
MSRMRNQTLQSNASEANILFVLNWKTLGECKFGQWIES